MQQNNNPPVSSGEEYDVKIESVGEKGDGIARVKGFVLFVGGTKAGEEVRIRITKVLAKVGFAEKIGPASAPIVKEQRGGRGGTPRTPRRRAEYIKPLVEEVSHYKDTEDFGDDDDEE